VMLVTGRKNAGDLTCHLWLLVWSRTLTDGHFSESMEMLQEPSTPAGPAYGLVRGPELRSRFACQGWRLHPFQFESKSPISLWFGQAFVRESESPPKSGENWDLWGKPTSLQLSRDFPDHVLPRPLLPSYHAPIPLSAFVGIRTLAAQSHAKVRDPNGDRRCHHDRQEDNHEKTRHDGDSSRPGSMGRQLGRCNCYLIPRTFNLSALTSHRVAV
jgi:hypothetical protein